MHGQQNINIVLFWLRFYTTFYVELFLIPEAIFYNTTSVATNWRNDVCNIVTLNVVTFSYIPASKTDNKRKCIL
jgi:hypothetical protein